MGLDTGIGGAFGINIRDYAEALGPLYEDFTETLASFDEDERYPEDGDLVDDSEDVDQYRHRICETFTPKMIEAFARQGIVVPQTAYLCWTGSEEDRMGRCAVQADEYILGFGVFTMPWDYPPMDESYRKASDWHTWVWGG